MGKTSSNGIASMTDITIQSGTTRTVQCQFTWRASGGYAYPATIVYSWTYYVGDSQHVYTGSSETLSYSTSTGTVTQWTSYTPPDNAWAVGFNLYGTSQTHEVTTRTWKKKDHKKKGKWVGKWIENKSTVSWFSDSCAIGSTFNFSTVASITVPSIELTVKGLKLTVSLNKYQLDAYTQTKYLVINTGGNDDTIQIVNGYASNNYSLTAGQTVYVKAKVYIPGVGNSDWTTPEKVIMPPAKPENIKAEATDKTQCLVSWTYPTNKDESLVNSYTIEYTTDTNDFEYAGKAQSASTSSNSGDTAPTSWPISDLSQGNVYYFRVKAVGDNGDSEWSDISQGITLGTKPTAPTTWSDVTSVLLGDTVTLFWTHNSSDGSYQRNAIIDVNGTEISWENKDSDGNPRKNDDDQPYYYLDTGTIASLTIGSKLVWKVKTKGVLDEYSDWSVERTINVCSAPTVEIEMPEVVETFPLNISITSDGGNGNPVMYMAYIISLDNYETVDDYGDTINISANQTLWSSNYDTTDEKIKIVIKPTDIRLSNGYNYKLYVTVASSNGLRTTKEFEFTSELSTIGNYLIDASIILDYHDDECPYLSIRPYIYDSNNLEDYNEIPSISGFNIDLYRYNFDGSYTEIETEMYPENAEYAIDPHPILTNAVYRIVATNLETGSVLTNTIQYPIYEPVICLNWDETVKDYTDPEVLSYLMSKELSSDDEIPSIEYKGYTGESLVLYYDIDTSEDSSVDSSLIEYAGRKHPVSYYGTQVGQTASWSCVIESDDYDTIDKLRKLQIYTGDVYCRNPEGIGYWANVKVSFSRAHAALTIPVSLSLTRVEGGK